MGERFSTAPSVSQTPAKCPMIQLNSNTIFLEIVSDPAGQGLGLTWLPHSTHTSDASYKASCLLCFWQKGCWSELPMPHSLLEWLTKLRETFYLLDHWFMIKEYNSGTARGQKCLGQAWKKGNCSGTRSLSSTCSPTWKLSEPYPFGFLWRLHTQSWLTHSLVVGNWLNHH